MRGLGVELKSVAIETLVHEARDWLNAWQDLTAAVVGAAALIWTVRWTLSTERRRRGEEAAAFRVALGTEIRLLAAAALGAFRELAVLRASLARDDDTVDIHATRLMNLCELPEPAVYSRGADRLGTLGEQDAFGVVNFYGMLNKLLRTVRLFGRLPDPWERLTQDSVIVVMGALLTTLDAALDALPAFESETWSEQDEKLAEDRAGARQAFKNLEYSRMRVAWAKDHPGFDTSKGPPGEVPN